MKQLMIRNTGNFIILEDEDFEIAKHCFWYEKKGYIFNEAGIELKIYCQMPKQRKKICPLYDYRRRWFNA